MEDFDKVSKIQRQITAETNELDSQLREKTARLEAEEKNHKSELASLKMRYESRVNLMREELQTCQRNVSRFKKERDAFKHLVEQAQIQMSELKRGSSSFANGSAEVRGKEGKMFNFQEPCSLAMQMLCRISVERQQDGRDGFGATNFLHGRRIIGSSIGVF